MGGEGIEEELGEKNGQREGKEGETVGASTAQSHRDKSPQPPWGRRMKGTSGRRLAN